MSAQTAPTPPLLPEAQRRTPFERVGDRLAATAAGRRLWHWLGPLLVTALAAVLRLADLAHPHALVFDETYYVKDAWSLWHLGFEGRWPEGSDELFLAGQVDGFGPDAAFVVHPPLGKWLIGLGMALLGPESGWGWRISAAAAGTVAVLVVILIARRLTGSTGWGCLAGLFLALDGLGIVLSRVALLDVFLMLFVVLAFWFLVLDRERSLALLAQRTLERSRGGAPAWGPVLWNRPWVLAAGAALGAACAVKWSAAWVLAAFGLYLVVTDALARRRAGVLNWPTDAIARQGPVSFLLLVPVALVVYVTSWTGWLVTAGGYDRDSDPNPFLALWNFHRAIYDFHVGLSSAHSYASPAWQWPLMLRPTSMHWQMTDAGSGDCAFASGCAQAITSIANPAVWYPAVAATVVLAVLFALRPKLGVRDWRIGLVLTAIGATYLPWLLYPERTIFQFYTVVTIPFLVLALTLAAQRIAGPADAPYERRLTGQAFLALLVTLVVAFAAFWLPLWTGMEVPYDFWRLHAPFDQWI